ncbi:unnamed protein product, partial [Prorocentrum cordatum]
ATPGISWIEGGPCTPSVDDPELRADVAYEQAQEEEFGPMVDNDLNRGPPEEVAKARLVKRRANMSVDDLASARNLIKTKLGGEPELAAAARAGRKEHVASTQRARAGAPSQRQDANRGVAPVPPRKQLRPAAPLPRREGGDAGEGSDDSANEGHEGKIEVEGDAEAPADGAAREVPLGTRTAREGHERHEWRKWGRENSCRVITITAPWSGDGDFTVPRSTAAHAGGLRPARCRKVDRPGAPSIARGQLDEVDAVIARLGAWATPQQVHGELRGPAPGSPAQRAAHRRRAEDRKGQQTNRLHGPQERRDESKFNARAAEGVPADKQRFAAFEDEELPVTTGGSVKIAFALWPFIEFAAREIDSVNGFCAMSDFAPKI